MSLKVLFWLSWVIVGDLCCWICERMIWLGFFFLVFLFFCLICWSCLFLEISFLVVLIVWLSCIWFLRMFYVIIWSFWICCIIVLWVVCWGSCMSVCNLWKFILVLIFLLVVFWLSMGDLLILKFWRFRIIFWIDNFFKSWRVVWSCGFLIWLIIL